MATLAPSPDKQQAHKPNALYERDFYSWSMQQADALKRRDFNAVDWDNVIEEIEDLAKAQRRSWRAYCARVIEHLLKIEYWDRSTEWVLGHWASEIIAFRREMATLIDDNLGLKGAYAEMFAKAWKIGRGYAIDKMVYSEEFLSREPADRSGRQPLSDESIQPQKHHGGAHKEWREKWGNILPEKRPYLFNHVTAYDAESDDEPQWDTWPPNVARILNARLNRNYPILPDYKPERGPSRGRQPSRGFTWDR